MDLSTSVMMFVRDDVKSVTRRRCRKISFEKRIFIPIALMITAMPCQYRRQSQENSDGSEKRTCEGAHSYRKPGAVSNVITDKKGDDDEVNHGHPTKME